MKIHEVLPEWPAPEAAVLAGIDLLNALVFVADFGKEINRS